VPDVKTFNDLAAGHGVGIAFLAIACLAMMFAVIALWKENRSLFGRIESLLTARVTALERLMEERSDANRSPRH
jgi:hypothetical protein